MSAAVRVDAVETTLHALVTPIPASAPPAAVSHANAVERNTTGGVNVVTPAGTGPHGLVTTTTDPIVAGSTE